MSTTGTTAPLSGPNTRNRRPRQHVCSVCNRAFKRAEHLTRHFRRRKYHIGSNASRLEANWRPDTKEKPFQCRQCQLCFARKELYIRHQQNVHGCERHEIPSPEIIKSSTLPRLVEQRTGSTLGFTPTMVVTTNATANRSDADNYQMPIGSANNSSTLILDTAEVDAPFEGLPTTTEPLRLPPTIHSPASSVRPEEPQGQVNSNVLDNIEPILEFPNTPASCLGIFDANSYTSDLSSMVGMEPPSIHCVPEPSYSETTESFERLRNEMQQSLTNLKVGETNFNVDFGCI